MRRLGLLSSVVSLSLISVDIKEEGRISLADVVATSTVTLVSVSLSVSVSPIMSAKTGELVSTTNLGTVNVETSLFCGNREISPQASRIASLAASTTDAGLDCKTEISPLILFTASSTAGAALLAACNSEITRTKAASSAAFSETLPEIKSWKAMIKYVLV